MVSLRRSRQAWIVAAVLALGTIAWLSGPAPADEPAVIGPESDGAREHKGDAHERPAPVDYLSPEFQVAPLREAVLSLTAAALLASALAFRPRRRGTPERSVTVAQTQIILAVVGSVVMIVVGASVARAFGIVGAASLVRYRAKVNDPKDAGVMLATLGIGLASGVGLFLFAAFATVFILGLLWILESREPEDLKRFALKMAFKEKDSAALKPRIEEVFRRNRVTYELRTTTPEELSYDVKIPARKTTDRLSSLILALGKPEALQVEWDEKKDKNK
jgi:uncharacterized membrane protein YhiD involved in acid resistance